MAEVTEEELAAAVAVVEKVAASADRGAPRFRALRTAVLPFVEDLRGRMFRGSADAEAHARRRKQRIDEQARRQREKGRGGMADMLSTAREGRVHSKGGQGSQQGRAGFAAWSGPASGLSVSSSPRTPNTSSLPVTHFSNPCL